MRKQIIGESELDRRTFFDSCAQSWDLDETPEKLNKLRDIFSNLSLYFDGNILDVGCGTGILVPILRNLSSNQNPILELDISRAMLQKNKTRWSPRFSRIHHLNGNAMYLPLSEGSISLVICFAVIPHISDKYKALNEFYRVLTTEGVLLILHLMSSEKLNELHASVGEAVANDRLPSADVMAQKVRETGFSLIKKEEKDDLYLIIGKK